MAEREQTGQFHTEDALETIEQQKSNIGRPASEKDEQGTDTYMSNLGAGTGVDIGPGAAGEMGGAAGTEINLAKQDERDRQNEEIGDDDIDRDVEYPDSGDLPRAQSNIPDDI